MKKRQIQRAKHHPFSNDKIKCNIPWFAHLNFQCSVHNTVQDRLCSYFDLKSKTSGHGEHYAWVFLLWMRVASNSDKRYSPESCSSNKIQVKTMVFNLYLAIPSTPYFLLAASSWACFFSASTFWYNWGENSTLRTELAYYFYSENL